MSNVPNHPPSWLTLLCAMFSAAFITWYVGADLRREAYDKGYDDAMEYISPQIKHLSGEYKRGVRVGWDTAFEYLKVAPPVHLPEL